jgi:hypothetical protein
MTLGVRRRTITLGYVDTASKLTSEAVDRLMNSEPTLLKLGYAFEQATRHRRAPQFLPTADLAT